MTVSDMTLYISGLVMQNHGQCRVKPFAVDSESWCPLLKNLLLMSEESYFINSRF